MTRLTDLIVSPELFNAGMIQTSITLDAWIQSGIAFIDPEINAFLNGPVGGKTFSKRFLKALGEDESNVSNDDPTDKSTPQKLSGLAETLIRQSRNESWSSMDLSAALYGSDPLGAVQTQLAKFWLTQRQNIMLKSSAGLIADNIANNGGDMVEDITGTGDGKFTGTGFIQAMVTMGDRMGELSSIGVHSLVMATLLENDQIVYIPDSEGKGQIATYKNRRVVMDDSLPVDPNAGDPIFTSVLYGNNCFAIGHGSPKVPTAVTRDEDAGNGGGQETIYSRVELAVHPVGYKYNGTLAANGSSPTWAELTDAANWTRVYDRKRIPMAFLKSKA